MRSIRVYTVLCVMALAVLSCPTPIDPVTEDPNDPSDFTLPNPLPDSSYSDVAATFTDGAEFSTLVLNWYDGSETSVTGFLHREESGPQSFTEVAKGDSVELWGTYGLWLLITDESGVEQGYKLYEFSIRPKVTILGVESNQTYNTPVQVHWTGDPGVTVIGVTLQKGDAYDSFGDPVPYVANTPIEENGVYRIAVNFFRSGSGASTQFVMFELAIDGLVPAPIVTAATSYYKGTSFGRRWSWSVPSTGVESYTYQLLLDGEVAPADSYILQVPAAVPGDPNPVSGSYSLTVNHAGNFELTVTYHDGDQSNSWTGSQQVPLREPRLVLPYSDDVNENGQYVYHTGITARFEKFFLGSQVSATLTNIDTDDVQTINGVAGPLDPANFGAALFDEDFSITENGVYQIEIEVTQNGQTISETATIELQIIPGADPSIEQQSDSEFVVSWIDLTAYDYIETVQIYYIATETGGSDPVVFDIVNIDAAEATQYVIDVTPMVVEHLSVAWVLFIDEYGNEGPIASAEWSAPPTD